jgi:hypothetical protein
VRPALIRWDPRAPLSLENCVVAEMKEVGRAMRYVFAVTEEGVPPLEAVPGSEIAPPRPRPDDYVDAVGDPIHGDALLTTGIVVSSPEDVWGVEAARVAQSRTAQARQFRQWALE